ncbi:DUF1329 domain-containing protein [bacterium]|jgi:hypothetical protein|nr:DUF1329 domain-containing protein [bacterium]
MRSKLSWLLAVVTAMFMLTPSLSMAQGVTDYSEVADWLKMSASQGKIPDGTVITMQNWQKYQQFMPLGMIKLFQGTYGWKMPADVQMPVGPSHVGGNLPETWVAATEKYGPQTDVQVLPNGHYVIKNYNGGTPFPNPAEPHKGWKVLANVFFSYVPAMYVKTPTSYGTVWAVDKYGDIAPSSLDVVYRLSDYITDKGYPKTENYAPGTWYTEWLMQESPEQARYTASLSLFYSDQESHPFPDTYVFVPALRRSLRLSTTSRCSPVFGFDWTNDDAKLNGFNGSTSIYTGKFLGDREILNLTLFDGKQAGTFPQDYDMPLGWPKPSWGKWELRPMAIDDVTRIPSEAAGYCYSHRILYADREFWSANWVDLFDSNNKLWKSIAYLNQIAPKAGGGYLWRDIAASMAMDLQNTHETIWSSYGNPNKEGALLDFAAPKEYFDGVKYGSPSGLMQILR